MKSNQVKGSVFSQLHDEKLYNMKLLNPSTLDLFSHEVTNLGEYREVFEMVAGLQYPDYYDRNDQEQEDDVPGENSNEEISGESGNEDFDGEEDGEDAGDEVDDSDVGLSYLHKSGLEQVDVDGDDFKDKEYDEDEEVEELDDTADDEATSRSVE